ncbi:FMN-binding protein [Butyrivibrio sp. INlla14]|uniref:FMN-binding protein n=1 Tax=Butyrivibrio sp. INlla14 TaxID=1520808 RepID=UPI000876B37B|nr:FMN-binding protein [Butyrivibrio sp. INlla14]SCY39901.1 DMSO/TMAO reductase YedYZ, heme-binding membrane subunit [Butyrivibrio sp. INlla14]
MKFLISFCLIVLLVQICGDRLRKKPLPYYVGAVILAAAAITVQLMPGDIFSGSIALKTVKAVLSYISGGAMVGALFTLVMFAGAFVQGSTLAKKSMPVRAQLSILGGILAIGHGIALGQSFIKRLNFTVEFVISLLLLLVMVPLFVTSFTVIRKKMNPKSWKKLQRLAYLFYLLTFIHILAFEMPKALRGVKGYALNVFAYFVVFVSYLFCRIFRSVYKNAKEKMLRAQVISVVAVLLIAAAGSFAVAANNARNNKSEDYVDNSGNLPEVIVDNEADGGNSHGNDGEYPEVAGARRTSENEDAGEILASGPKEVEVESSESYHYIDGTYYGEGMGNNGKIGVNVTIQSGMISAIEIVKFPDDADYFDVEKDGSKMTQQMIAIQNAEVDTVSGATYSSEGLIDAVSAALKEAESGASE